MLENLKTYSILLASNSPRRRELLKMLDIDFEVPPAIAVDESYSSDLPPTMVPAYLARLKAKAYYSLLEPNRLLITADTVVIANNQILGKPTDKEEAAHMLKLLSGNTHMVVTGVALTSCEKQVIFSVESKVTFSDLTDEEISYYVDHYSPLDKAGAYGIQEWIGAVAVKKICGSYYNVMGLPVHQLYRHLLNF